MITNEQIANEFDKLASLLEFLDRNDPADPFRIRTYRKVANIIRNYDKDIYTLYKEGKLEKIPGFGKETWSKLLEFLENKKISSYEKLKESIPDSVLELMEISGIGPKLAKQLYDILEIKSVDDLKNLIDSDKEKLLQLPRMGEKKIEQIVKGLQMYSFTKTRTPLGIIYPYAYKLLDEVLNFNEVKRASIAGSLRRMKETIGDIDILVYSTNPLQTIEKFSKLDNIDKVLVKGDTKISVFLSYPHIQVDLRVVPEDSFGAALQYFTGSKQHNIHLRTIAKELGYKISEYGIFKKNDSNKDDSYIKVGGKNEDEIYKILGLDYIVPEMREDLGEIELSKNHNLPNLIGYNDLKGDLHTHSNWSDGQNTMEEMIQEAISLGYEYIGITDHSPSLSIANGLDEKRIIEKIKEVRQLRQKYRQIKILMGTEVDILSDGSLDYENEILKNFDIVIASIHRGYNQDQTERYLKALDNPYITAIGHPTGRLIGERDMMKVDWEKIFKKAIDKNILMEINSQPLRLDLPDFLIRQFAAMGGKFLINTDAHSIKCLKTYSKYGIGQARRAWLSKEQVINTYSWNEFSKKLNLSL